MTCALLLTALALAADAPSHDAALIFPPDPKHNHSSSIVETPSGDLLVCWFHGSGERTADDVEVLGARKRKGADEWSTPFLMADTPNLPDCNPVLFLDPRGTLWLIWVTIQENEWGTALLKYRTSTDYDGDGPPRWNWQDVIHTRVDHIEEPFLKLLDGAEEALGALLKSSPRFREEIEAARGAAQNKLARRLGWMPRIHPLMIGENRMMLGLYSDVFNCSLAAITDDWGATWTCSAPIMDPKVNMLGNIQPSFVVKKNGDIVAYMRDNGLPNRIRTAESSDNGMTWPRNGMLEIRNPGSSVDAIALASGRWLLICNDTVDGRHLLSAYLSDDEGATWPHRRALEEMEPGQGSFSYPSVIQTRDGAIHCTYSHKIEGGGGSSIKHARFNEAWVLDAPAAR